MPNVCGNQLIADLDGYRDPCHARMSETLALPGPRDGLSLGGRALSEKIESADCPAQPRARPRPRGNKHANKIPNETGLLYFLADNTTLSSSFSGARGTMNLELSVRRRPWLPGPIFESMRFSGNPRRTELRREGARLRPISWPITFGSALNVSRKDDDRGDERNGDSSMFWQTKLTAIVPKESLSLSWRDYVIFGHYQNI